MTLETIGDGMKALQERHERERKEMDAQIALASELAPAGLPVPQRIMFANGGAAEPWIIYGRKTRQEALDILNAWDSQPGRVLGARAIEAGCVYVGPNAKREGRERWASDWVYVLAFTSGEGFGPDVELSFWASHAGKTVRVKMDLKTSEEYSRYADWPHPIPHVRKLDSEEWRRTSSYDRRGSYEKAYPSLGEWQVIKWASENNSIHVTYYYDRAHMAVLEGMLK